MANMSKRELVTRIAGETGLIQSDVRAIVQQTLDYITEALAAGRNVELRNFGVFRVAVRKKHFAQNPNRPHERIVIPDRKVVKFRQGRVMKKLITGI
jgi:nucleoid DNA-binding protein